MKKDVGAAIIIISLIIVGYFSSSMLLPFPYGLAANLAIVGIGIFFLVQLARKKFKFQKKNPKTIF